MPKWGLSMTHGKVVEWLVPERAEVSAGTEVVEVETEKITGCVESSKCGILRRQVAKSGQDVPIGGLLAVVADLSVSDDEVNRFVEGFVLEEACDESASDDIAPEFVEVGGRRLRYLKQGEGGQPVVLIHGFTGNLDNWLFNHAALAQQRAVYALDLPGHGQSSKDVGDGSLDMLIGTLQDWLDALSLSRVHLVGHSLGGAVALGVALRSPDRVRSCTLIATAALGPEIDADYVEGVVEASRRKQLKPYLERLFADPSRVTRQLVHDLLKFKRVDGVPHALSKLSKNFVANGKQVAVFRSELEQVQSPTQVIWGEADQIIPSSHASDLPDPISVELLANCGHMVQMEAAREVNQLVLSFLEKTD
ncbi:MAG: acetoin dehydrogenase dihydrolipoyllysine-residue acetyltransferase subunit [Planctomycetaceae bacterium]|nr:acetoin dehydrogenase dihydrolipoyllysine-residue acetyltransferase subunit [Planctomycetaceae bacterium]